jgi:ATP-binding cassette subfamily G (WHITE) protein 2
VPWFGQFSVLCGRTLREQTRKWPIMLVQFVQAVIMAVLIGTTFLLVSNPLLILVFTFSQLPPDQSGVTLRNSVLFFCCINQGVFGALITINSFPCKLQEFVFKLIFSADRTLSLRERAAGTYQVSAYFLAKNCIETLVSLPMPIIFSCIVYWLIGLQVGIN